MELPAVSLMFLFVLHVVDSGSEAEEHRGQKSGGFFSKIHHKFVHSFRKS